MKKLSKDEMKTVVGGLYPSTGGGDCGEFCDGSCTYTCPGSTTVYTGGKCGGTPGSGCSCASAC